MDELQNQPGQTPNVPNPPQDQPTMGPAPEVPAQPQIQSMEDHVNQAQVADVKPEPTVTAPPVFDADEPVFTPETTNNVADPVDNMIAEGGGSRKWLWIIIAVVVIGLGVGAFFFFRGGDEPTDPLPDDNQVTIPVDQPEDLVEDDSASIPEEEITYHFSVFTAGSVDELEASLDSLDENSIRSALVAMGEIANEGITEILFTSEQSQPDFHSYINIAVPSMPLVEDIFEDDFTTFVYKDENGVWPGYIATGDVDTADSQISDWLTQMENAFPGDFFIVDAGEFSADFQDGTVFGLPDRYNPGSTPGASLGYLQDGRTVLISTSFDGMKEAMKLLNIGIE